MKPPLKQGHPDDFQTPPHALWPLLPYLPKEWTVWECAAGQGNLSNELIKRGYNVISTDKENSFLKWRPDEFDCIVTNPPYSLKNEFVERCYKIGKPFALLLPLTGLEGQPKQRLYKKYGVQLIIFNRRINFTIPEGEPSGAWFMTAWFTNKLNLPLDINFVELENPDQRRITDE